MSSADFWRRSPYTNREPDVLLQQGMSSLSQSDGMAMIAIGWALWDQVGLHSHQAVEFLRDGFSDWRRGPLFDLDEALEFLVDLFERLWAEPAPSNMDALASFHRARAWAATTLLDTAEDAGRKDVAADYGPLVYEVIASTPRDFLAPRAVLLATAHAESEGRPAPRAT